MGSIVGLDWRCSEMGYRLNRDHLHYMDQLAEVVVVVVASMLERWVAIAGHHATSRYPPLDSGLTSSGRNTAYSDCSHLLLQFELLLLGIQPCVGSYRTRACDTLIMLQSGAACRDLLVNIVISGLYCFMRLIEPVAVFSTTVASGDVPTFVCTSPELSRAAAMGRSVLKVPSFGVTSR